MWELSAWQGRVAASSSGSSIARSQLGELDRLGVPAGGSRDGLLVAVDGKPGRPVGRRLRSYADVNVEVKPRDEAHQVVEGEEAEPPPNQGRDARLVDAEHLAGFNLGPTPFLDDCGDA